MLNGMLCIKNFKSGMVIIWIVLSGILHLTMMSLMTGMDLSFSSLRNVSGKQVGQFPKEALLLLQLLMMLTIQTQFPRILQPITKLFTKYREVLPLGLSYLHTEPNTLQQKMNCMITLQVKITWKMQITRESVSVFKLSMTPIMIIRSICTLMMRHSCLVDCHTESHHKQIRLMYHTIMPQILKVIGNTATEATALCRCLLQIRYFNKLQVIKMHGSQRCNNPYQLKQTFLILLARFCNKYCLSSFWLLTSRPSITQCSTWLRKKNRAQKKVCAWWVWRIPRTGCHGLSITQWSTPLFQLWPG